MTNNIQRSAAASELEHAVTSDEAMLLADAYLDRMEVKQHYTRDEYIELMREMSSFWTGQGLKSCNLQRVCNMTVKRLKVRRLLLELKELVK